MPKSNDARAIVTQYLERFNQNTSGEAGEPAWLMFDEDCTFEVAGSLDVSRVYHGLDTVARECMALLLRRLPPAPGNGWFLERFIGHGSRVVALLRSRSQSVEGRPYCGSYFVVFEVRDNRIVHQLEILDTALFMDCVHDMRLEP